MAYPFPPWRGGETCIQREVDTLLTYLHGSWQAFSISFSAEAVKPEAQQGKQLLLFKWNTGRMRKRMGNWDWEGSAQCLSEEVVRLLFWCSQGRDDILRVVLWKRGDYCWVEIDLRRIAPRNAEWTNYTKMVHLLNRHQGFLNHHRDPSRHNVIRAHVDWLVKRFLPQMRDFPKLLMLTPERDCKMITLSCTDESLRSTLVLHLGQSVGSACAPTVITFWAKEQPWSSSPWVFVIIYIVLRWD